MTSKFTHAHLWTFILGCFSVSKADENDSRSNTCPSTGHPKYSGQCEVTWHVLSFGFFLLNSWFGTHMLNGSRSTRSNTSVSICPDYRTVLLNDIKNTWLSLSTSCPSDLLGNRQDQSLDSTLKALSIYLSLCLYLYKRKSILKWNLVIKL